LVSMADSNGVQTYFLQDGLGSTTGLTDDDGSMTDTYTYDVFGAMRSHVGASANSYRFTGELQDSQAARGLYYLRARYYDPALGRFLSRDPFKGFVAGPQSQNRYIYNGNDPVDLVDPYGLCGLRSPGDLADCGKKAAEKVGEGVEKVGEGANKLSDVVYDALPENVQFLFDFGTGTGKDERYYGPGSAQARGMQQSGGAQRIRDKFVANGCMNIEGIYYDTGEAYKEWLHPLNPAAEVGGFAGASATRVYSDSKEGNDMMRIHIENDAGWSSFTAYLFLGHHVLPNNPFGRGGPLRTIHQTFEWYEPLPAACLK
jgi:RHS repeat-associated protein